MIRRYSELIGIPTFEERYEYLKLNGKIGYDTFGFDRYLNQQFYRSKEWKSIRDYVIMRDYGHDLAMQDPMYEIHSIITVHHMNPMAIKDITDHNPEILDPEFLISVSEQTHKAIHFGDRSNLPSFVVLERRPNDTCLWR